MRDPLEKPRRTVSERNDRAPAPPVDRSPTIANPSTWSVFPWLFVIGTLGFALVQFLSTPRVLTDRPQPLLDQLVDHNGNEVIIIHDGGGVRHVTVEQLRAEQERPSREGSPP